MLIQHLIKELDPCHRHCESDNDYQNGYNYDNDDDIDEANDGDDEDSVEKNVDLAPHQGARPLPSAR